jgi:Ser/Thr protein kinase RdoA (MazF antagonist)
MESEVAFLRWVESVTDIEVPRAIANRSGEFVVVGGADGIPHERSCVLFSWLRGGHLSDQINQKTMTELGRVMAVLHEAGRTFKPPRAFTAPTFDSVYPWDIPFVLFERADSTLLPGARRELYRTAEAFVRSGVDSLLKTEPPRMTHADIHPWNVKVYRGSLAVFDFEDLLWAWPVQDLATTLYYFWSRDNFDECWTHLRTGYETVSPWPDRGGEIATFIMGRTLVMGNDVLSQEEFVGSAPTIFANGERRIKDMLERVGAGR